MGKGPWEGEWELLAVPAALGLADLRADPRLRAEEPLAQPLASGLPGR